jgi:hypothetical protein
MFSLADAPSLSEEDRRREAAVAEFTRKMKDANYPMLFEQAAKEFNVPADILKGVAFAETRWEHLMWPPGDTESSETGMPRPYGIMSLWDNRYFGHSLIEAAHLIGQEPDVLKRDPLQNMRGAAALLRTFYDETAKPPGTTEADIESWRYAIRRYCGIPEPDLNASHALDVYVFMNRGYHQYGIEWNARPVNLAPIREETKRIVAEERAKKQLVMTAGGNGVAETNRGPVTNINPGVSVQSNTLTEPPPPLPSPSPPPAPSRRKIWAFIFGAIAALAALWVFSRKPAS